MSPKKFVESRDDMESILREESVGYLGMSMDGMPYVVPLNYSYVDGKVLFHCALAGKKLDYLRANPQVCFTVGRQSGSPIRHPQGALCHGETDSVMCYGVARIVENIEERREVLDAFNHCLQPDAPPITLEDASKCFAVEIRLTEMTGRRERGLERTRWHYSFDR
jgi:nitroimidazol reductase NimA-like FMN-containing flavoprotein (pyridoxamine 5'-phosphate oxidase superfamily)